MRTSLTLELSLTFGIIEASHLEEQDRMANLAARLNNAWHRHGPIGFLYLIVYNIVYHIGAKLSRTDDSFDRRYGTDTRQVREIGSLDGNRAAAARRAVRYEPSSAKVVREILERLKIDYP